MAASEPLSVAEFETLARQRMEPGAFDYFSGAAGDEWTLAENIRAFARIALRPRVLVDVSTIDTATSIFGDHLAFPVLLAPTALNRVAHPDGEVAVARAAGRAGVALVLSAMASSTIEEVREAASGPLWFQLFVYRDRQVTRDLVHRAETSGYRALTLTVDMPRLGRRERDARNNFRLPPGVTIRNLEMPGRSSSDASFFEYVHGLLDPALTWEAVAWLKSITRLPIVIKGLLTGDDADRAIEAGAAGIVVSNHGGRQLDGAVATIDALVEIVDRVAGRVPVLLDGGIRRGTDILKAVALGAHAVLIGRPYLWALAAEGERGVQHVLELLRAELELAMALAGCPALASITSSLISLRRG